MFLLQPVSSFFPAAVGNYRAVGPGLGRLALTAVGTERTTAAGISSVLFSFDIWGKLTFVSMQSESGIVPDFEVGEEFQEEPKTYYELKSQPLKNRSVLQPGQLLVMVTRVWYLGDNKAVSVSSWI